MFLAHEGRKGEVVGFYLRGRGPVGFSFSGPASLLALPGLLIGLFVYGLVFAVVGFAKLSVPAWRWLGRAIVTCAVWTWRFYRLIFRQVWKLLAVGYRAIRRALQERSARRAVTDDDGI